MTQTAEETIRPTHRLLSSIGALKVGTRGTVRLNTYEDMVEGAPEIENVVDDLIETFPLVFIPLEEDIDDEYMRQLMRSTGGVVVRSTEVKEIA